MPFGPGKRQALPGMKQRSGRKSKKGSGKPKPPGRSLYKKKK